MRSSAPRRRTTNWCPASRPCSIAWATTGRASTRRCAISPPCPRKNDTQDSRRLPVADIHIVRSHTLGLAQARKLAFRWAEVAEQKLAMECTYEEGKTSDLVRFERPGADGTLKVTKD